MTTLKKYRLIISAALLALYAFIITPVQLWHKHNYTANSNTSNSKEETSLSKYSATNAEANCKICSHHYSVYSNDAVSLVTPQPIISLLRVVLLESFYNPSSQNILSDRAPPVLA